MNRLIVIGLFLVFNLRVTIGEENNATNKTLEHEQQLQTTSTTEKLQISEKINEPVQSFEKDISINSDIDRSSHFHHHVHENDIYNHGAPYHGFWKKKFVWRPRWVKTWQEKKVYVAVWKRMWSPASVNEWVPIPKPPPGWIKPSAGKLAVKLPY